MGGRARRYEGVTGRVNLLFAICFDLEIEKTFFNNRNETVRGGFLLYDEFTRVLLAFFSAVSHSVYSLRAPVSMP